MKTKRKIIIKILNRDISEIDAINKVLTVIQEGRVSIGAKDKKHYCWITAFMDGGIVSVTPKYKTDSDIFTVYK